ncbi:hypothetical protein [Paenibacillus soyae]|uniref:Uncharacterized protein n=1 Tax=Paenibacillus soyae TaxID=2969249 RepID=A0A9X2MPC7_9BACL|nr:hypothetical protein [Paenibacillus soyae]MCR2803388.1 hypothetical protein [Paenibacillus soyae]
MKRIAVYFFIMLLVLQGIPYQKADAEEPTAGIDSAQESIDLANQYMKDHMNYEGDYYGIKSATGRSIIDELAVKGNAAFNNLPIFVYGSPMEGAQAATKYGNDTRVEDDGQLRALGFSYTDEPYANPLFHIDDITYVRRWIKDPWELPSPVKRDIRKELLPDNPKDKHTYQWLSYEPDKFASAYSVMNQWINSNKWLPNRVEKMTGDRKFFNRSIEGVPEVLADNPEDYIYMIQPPTYHSWGVGIAFYYYGGNGPDNMEKPNYYLYYQYFRYKPFAMLENDLSAHFELLPSNANAGDPVEVAINLKSTFGKEVTTDYAWDIRTASGDPISATYSGHATKKSGDITFKEKGERLLRARFVMPESNVSIQFAMNKDKDSPQERNYDNNSLSSSPTAVKVVVPTPPFRSNEELGYNILSKKLRFDLNGGSPLSASLSLPANSSWNGNATGSLNVSNGQPDLFRQFAVSNNPPVDEASAHISREPVVSTQILRTDFGDNPVGGGWLNWTTPGTPKYRTGDILASGTVSRPFLTERIDCDWVTNSEGEQEQDCDTTYLPGSSTGVFPDHTDRLTVGAYIYNGRQSLPAISYLNKIDGNTTSSLQKILYWKNEPYRYDVVRWMAHEDENGGLYGWTPVPGQYDRSFTHQANGELKWTVGKSQEAAYKQSREAAKKKQNVQSAYDIAVFATDKELQKYDYPIKSGYYFNPAGQYTFTIETEMYKPSQANTKDHADLVDQIIDSFSYESDLIYINNNKEAVNVEGQKLSMNRNVPVAKKGVLTRDNPNGVNGWKLLDVDENYTKRTEALPHTQERDGTMHAYWRAVLEGYNESSTIGSYNNYEYREFVKNGQKTMYKVTEKTTVTITIAPEADKKLYTHAHMPDGTYKMEAKIGGIALTGLPHAYKTLPTLQGIDLGNSNRLTITVRGSMYDDLNG